MGSGDGIKNSLSIALVVGICCLGLGIIIGWFSSQGSFPNEEAYAIWNDALKEADDGVSELIMNEMKPDNIKGYLRRLTSTPHLGGTEEERINAEYIKQQWDDQGLDSSRIVKYNILLSYPQKDHPNFVYVLSSDGDEVFKTAAEEAELAVGDKDERTVPPFNAYAKATTVQGDLVYVNYGRVEDFQQLERELNINMTGKIAIARYGKIFRGDKANQAFNHGAIGLILYSDPADYALDDTDRVYPDTWFLPGTGIQRGNVITVKGDPLTQGYPATDYMYRNAEEDVTLSKIPVQPIGYDDAKEFLKRLAGVVVPEGWSGNLPDLTYRLGPGLNNGTVKLEVNNVNEIRPVHDVIGIIKGSLEPDRYVILGNHRDAWVFGAVDPSSGTSTMLELSRTLGKLVREGKWRPRRSILFASWGAEEYGLMGSYEWVEEFGKTVAARTIAYVNCDSAMSGNFTFEGRSTPNLYNVLYKASKKVPDAPDHGGTVFDTWLKESPRSDKPGVPRTPDLGSGSDFRPFMGLIGIPSIDIRYTRDKSLGLSSYPLYHSMYETFHLMSAIMDPTFQYHLAIGRVWGEIARILSDSLIVPLDCTAYAERMADAIKVLKERYAAKMAARTPPITFGDIDANMAIFTTAAAKLHQRIDAMDKINPLAVRMVNDQLMMLERAFLDPLGLPERPLERHAIFAPSSKDSYTGVAFSGIVDLMFDIENAEDPDSRWEEVERYMTIVAFTLESAATTLMESDVLAKDVNSYRELI